MFIKWLDVDSLAFGWQRSFRRPQSNSGELELSLWKPWSMGRERWECDGATWISAHRTTDAAIGKRGIWFTGLWSASPCAAHSTFADCADQPWFSGTVGSAQCSLLFGAHAHAKHAEHAEHAEQGWAHSRLEPGRRAQNVSCQSREKLICKCGAMM